MSKRSPHPPETVAAAEMLYVIERRSQKEVQDRLGVSSSTFRRWKDKYRWDDKRAESIITIPELVRDMKADVKRTYDKAREEDRPLTSGERDGVFKTISKMQQLDKGALFTQHGIQVMDLFSAYLKEHAPQLQPPLVEHIVQFTRRLAATPVA
jgi:transposase-like protein